MSEEKRTQLKKTIDNEIKKTILSLEEYKQLTKPIKPENSIGRVSRMDAINNKSVIEAALKKVEEKLKQLEFIKTQVDNDDFGICINCYKKIPIEKQYITTLRFKSFIKPFKRETINIPNP